jgi:hypothetical protein
VIKGQPLGVRLGERPVRELVCHGPIVGADLR